MRGVKEKRARVFKESKVTDLVQFLEAKVQGATGIDRCMLLMDKAAIQYLWESWARGKECGELEVEQIDFEAACVTSRMDEDNSKRAEWANRAVPEGLRIFYREQRGAAASNGAGEVPHGQRVSISTYEQAAERFHGRTTQISGVK